MEHQQAQSGKLRTGWAKLSEGKKTFYLYSLLFFIVFFVAFSPFMTEKSSFICSFDGRETNIQENVFYGRWVRQILRNFLHGDFTIPLYDFSRGWGSRIIESGIDPILILVAPFFNLAYTESLYSILIILRLYLAGLSFLYLCRYFKKDRYNALAGCFVYLFSAYMIYGGLAFPGYITPMIQLPLLIVGAEKVMRKERSMGFVFSVLYVAIGGYYHLYIQTILIGIYCIVRLFALYPKAERWKALPGRLGSGIGKWLLGIGMASFALLPAMLGFGSASRSSFSNISISGSIAVHWNYFWRRLMTLISPIRNYDWDWGMDYPAYAAIFLLCAVVIFTAGRKKKFTQKWLLGIGLFMLFCPWCGLVMNGMQYPCNRWSFGLALLAGFLVADTIPDLFSMSGTQKKACAIAVVAYGCIAVFFTAIRREVFASVGTAFLAATLLIVLYSTASEKMNRFKTALCLGLVCLNVCANTLYLVSPESMGWIAWFSPMEKETEQLALAVEGEPPYSPYGYEIQDGRIDSTYLFYINSIVYGQPATCIYSPLLNGNIVEFRDATESCGNVQYFKIYSSDQRTMLNSLLSVDQQFEGSDSVQYVPYGYKYCGDTFLGYKVFQNQYSLGWGYTYDSSIPYEAAEGRNGIEVQELMMRSVLLDSDQQIKAGTVETESERIPCTYQCAGCTWEDGIVSVENGGGAIVLLADLPAGKEYYIRIKGFDLNGFGDEFFTISTSASFNISVESGGVMKYARAMDSSYPWYYGRENYLFCLGCLEEDRNYVQFQIPAGGTFKLEDIELYALPLDHYPEQAEKLRQNTLENVVLGDNTFSGTIDVTGNKVLCVTVPYEEGWTAYVDGQEAELLRANYAFMGLKLAEGHHEILLKFHVPYLKTGILVSCLSLGITVVFLILQKKKRGEKQKEEASI
ncbi:MAG: YfhO family protein [Oscillospiraceae bacterium]|nr:YfhO family protein [Oscillospiraceae bacterium]